MNAVSVADRTPLAEICPKCGNRMTRTVMEHVIVVTCTRDGYEAKDIDGDSKLAFYVAIGSFYITRSSR